MLSGASDRGAVALAEVIAAEPEGVAETSAVGGSPAVGPARDFDVGA